MDMRHITRQLLIGSAAALAVALAATAALAEQPVPIDANVAQWEALDANTVLVLSSEDNNLWLEYAPFGTMPPLPCFVPLSNVQQFSCRIQIDANVASFETLGNNIFSVFVQSSLDNKLWWEFGPFGGIDLQNWPTCTSSPPVSCRIQVDGNVAFFDATPQGLFGGIQAYVISSQDHNLWLEYGPFGGFDPQNWPTCTSSPPHVSCRIQVDGNVGYNVRHPSLSGVDYVFVQSSLDNKLWLEYGPFGGFDPQNWPTCMSYTPASCRIQVDGKVQSFWPLNLNTVFVVGSDNNLWLEFGPFGTVPLPECVYPNSQQCRYWIASGAWALSALDQYSIFVNGDGPTFGGMLSFYNLVGIVP
jgi:hypothetical protein